MMAGQRNTRQLLWDFVALYMAATYLCDGTCVQVADADDALLFAVLVQAQAGTVVADSARVVTHNDGTQVHLAALHVLCGRRETSESAHLQTLCWKS